jgi:heme/copper-type cytochrome/quinol oxidase subunit 2
MPIVVRVVTDAEYTAWVKEKKAAAAQAAAVSPTAVLASAQ